MFGPYSSFLGMSLAALAISLTPAEANASPRRHARSARVAAQRSCSKRVVEILAGKESGTFALARCDGSASAEGVDQLSLLARPNGVSRPKASLATLEKVQGPDLAPGIRRVDPRLVEKLELVAEQFRKPGESEHIVLGPGGMATPSAGSPRTTVRTLDFRVEGVSGRAVTSFCKALPDTDCAPSPRGAFVRMGIHAASEAHVADADPLTPAPAGADLSPPASSQRTGKLAPLPGTARLPAASAVKPADSERFL